MEQQDFTKVATEEIANSSPPVEKAKTTSPRTNEARSFKLTNEEISIFLPKIVKVEKPPKYTGKKVELKNFKNLTTKQFERFRKQKSFDLKYQVSCGAVCLCFGVIIALFVLSIMATTGIIDNSRLENAFFDSVLIIFGAIVGFAIGIFHEKTK